MAGIQQGPEAVVRVVAKHLIAETDYDQAGGCSRVVTLSISLEVGLSSVPATAVSLDDHPPLRDVCVDGGPAVRIVDGQLADMFRQPRMIQQPIQKAFQLGAGWLVRLTISLGHNTSQCWKTALSGVEQTLENRVEIGDPKDSSRYSIIYDAFDGLCVLSERQCQHCFGNGCAGKPVDVDCRNSVEMSAANDPSQR